MKKLMSIVALAVLALLPSACSKSNEKADELLRSVPGTTAGVGMINLERLAKESGVTKDGDKIVLPQSVKDLFGNNRDAEKLFTSGAIEMSVMAVYVDADAVCVTGYTANPAKLSEILGDEVVVRDDRFWVCERTGSNARIADNAQERKADDSFAAYDYASTLTNLDNYDIRAIANIQGLVALSGDRDARMGMALLGSMGGARYVTYNLTSTKGKVEMDMGVLNSDFNKVDMPDLPDIDLKGVEKLHGHMEIVGAFAVNEKIMTGISQSLPNLIGRNLPIPDASTFYRLVGSIDGTIAMGGTIAEQDVNWELAIPFAKDQDAKDALSFANMFTEGSPVFTRQDKNILYISNVNLSSPLNGPQNIKALKGQSMGIVAGQSFFSNPNMRLRQPLPVKAASLTCGKKDGTQTLVLTIETTGEKNGLFTLMEGMSNL